MAPALRGMRLLSALPIVHLSGMKSGRQDPRPAACLFSFCTALALSHAGWPLHRTFFFFSRPSSHWSCLSFLVLTKREGALPGSSKLFVSRGLLGSLVLGLRKDGRARRPQSEHTSFPDRSYAVGEHCFTGFMGTQS